MLRDAVSRVRALVVVIACAVGAVLGLGAFALAQAASACAGSSGSGLAAGCEERLGAAVAPGVVGDASVRGVPASTATRHVPEVGEPGARRGPSPATDRAMALLVGWGVLVLIGGGFCCGRRRREPEPEVEGQRLELRVRVPRQRSGSPRHLLGAPPRGPRGVSVRTVGRERRAPLVGDVEVVGRAAGIGRAVAAALACRGVGGQRQPDVTVTGRVGSK
ncbi:hypothetical protein [Pseudonocardia acaciae]|uniref:hypothetical protein n=1 Tax=Pseudonocardia acaciae TaxID=551276 RepID=UPI0012ED7B20|nr:hypothetical protein [Pseudonocardia acaciae]